MSDISAVDCQQAFRNPLRLKFEIQENMVSDQVVLSFSYLADDNHFRPLSEPGTLDDKQVAVSYVNYFLTEVLNIGQRLEGIGPTTLNKTLIDRILTDLQSNNLADCTTY